MHTQTQTRTENLFTVQNLQYADLDEDNFKAVKIQVANFWHINPPSPTPKRQHGEQEGSAVCMRRDPGMKKDTQPKKEICVWKCQLMSENNNYVQLENFRQVLGTSVI